MLSHRPLRKQKFTSAGSKDHGLRLVDVDPFCVVCREDLCYDVLLCDVKFSRFSFYVFLPSYWNMASWDSQGEVVPIELPNPQETQIWESENKSALSRKHLILQHLLIIAAFIWHARIGCYGNSLIDIEGKAKILKLFDNASHVLSETAVSIKLIRCCDFILNNQ